jgi:ATP-dependent RNA helicase DeaD
MTFDKIGLSENLLKAISDMGFTQPTPIQEKTIPLILSSENDVLALAQTGTGKTAAFGLPIIDQLDPELKSIQSIILCPTRELCRQISSDLAEYSKYIKRCAITSVYGGASMQSQIQEIKRGTQIVVGTPGRVVDMIKRGYLALENIRFVVLDEADEMLNMGFKEDLDFILSSTSNQRQTLLFSATMPVEVRRIAKAYMNKPQEVSVQKNNESAANIEHTYHTTTAQNRFETLRRIVDFNPDIYGIVFCRTRRETQQVSDKLITSGYNADALHGELSQAQRDSVMQKFRTKHLQILVATDVAARGIDVDDITHVIHYNLPDDIEAYIHRSGRTARAGKSGSSIALVSGREKSRIRLVEKKIGKQVVMKPIPQGKDICVKQLFKLVEDLGKVDVSDEGLDDFMPAIFEKLEGYSKEDLIKRFFAAEFNRFHNYYKDSSDLNLEVSSRGDRRDRDRGRDRDRSRGGERDAGRNGRKFSNDDHFERREKKSRSRSFTRFFINMGKKDELNPNRLMGFINEQPGLEGVAVGRIEVLKTFSFFEIDAANSDAVIGEMKGKDFRGRNIDVELASSDVGASHHHAKRVKKDKKSFGANKRARHSSSY